MKARHAIAFAVLAGVLALVLTSCNLLGVSIADRVSTFQADLNTSTRSNVYLDFVPGSNPYNTLKSSSLTGFNTTYPPPGPTYTLAVVDSSSPSTGVIVQVTSGSHGAWAVPYFLSMTMLQVGSDWFIATLSDSQTNGSYTPRYY